METRLRTEETPHCPDEWRGLHYDCSDEARHAGGWTSRPTDLSEHSLLYRLPRETHDTKGEVPTVTRARFIRWCAGFLVLATFAGRPASAAEGRSTFLYEVPGERVFPESLAVDDARGIFYVSGAFDGTVYRGRKGRTELEVFLPAGGDGRTTAQGLRLDARGLLYVAGGVTGQMWVYDTRTRALVRRFDTGLTDEVFINDVALDRAGNAYFTDSYTAVLWRLPAAEIKPSPMVGRAERFIDLTGTTVRYQDGFNLNGIVLEHHGRSLLTVQSNTGKLFRIGLDTRQVTELPVEHGPLYGGDGMTFIGDRLLVTRYSPDQLDLLDVAGSGATVTRSYTDPTFHYAASSAALGDRLLVANAQFDRYHAANPVLPFTISAVPLENLGR
ncbi:SMP-30/gluconolactonase/LRE family protein [Nonomuraea sp. NPDC050783]|uniref:SMP-30/gluconolactonase/LRE family protein n=1 Tax=Nonomuraea sp. NPDC050783 TaxID=3154634 RepID=UPI00346668E6